MGKLFCSIITVCILVGWKPISAQDTIKAQILDNVYVSESSLFPDIASKQILDFSTNKIPALQLSDAVKFFSGIVVKDYGGVGGMKTISVRGLGANHTAVSYDGVSISESQTGQIDLGKFSLDNIADVSLQTGLGNQYDIFKPARLFSSANILFIETTQPKFISNKPINIKAAVKMGSWWLINPYLKIENKIGEKIKTALQGEYLYTKGDYPYTLYYGGQNDSTSQERRTNSDISMFRLEGDLFYTINTQNVIRFKAYYYNSQRGLPGATILYNTESDQRLWNENLFLQGHYKYSGASKFLYQLYLKTNYSCTRYLDPQYLNAERVLNNTYYQREYYMSNSVAYEPVRKLLFTLANDMFIENMGANILDFPYPTRYNLLTNIAAVYTWKWMSYKTSLLHTFIIDKTQESNQSNNFNKFSPSASMEFYLLKSKRLILNLLYQNTFRMPTFNDLYYTAIGNKNLNPERVNQFSFGIAWNGFFNKHLPYLSLSANAYHNRVKDKIVAIPTKNLFIWSMVNFGIVRITGADATLKTTIYLNKYVNFDVMGNYSFQYAIDMTDSTSKTYKNQIPYTPRHSGTGQLIIHTLWVDLGYTILMSGKRYTLGQNIEENLLNGYADQSISLSKYFKIKKIGLLASIEVLNIANTQYEIIRNFPMQGTSFRVKIEFTL